MISAMSVGIAVLSICILVGTSSAESAFHLDQISGDFPSRGLEHQIQFWTDMFTRYGEADIVFHDRDDVRIVYEVVDVSRGIERDPEEAKRQRRILEKKKTELRGLLADLEAGSSPGPKHQRLSRMVTSLGYESKPDLWSRLQENIRYQRGVRERFQSGLIRSGRYLEAIYEIFAEEGLPEVLALLPHIESSFDDTARSTAGAAGIWQIVRATGRPHLRMNRYVDERLDPLASSQAAARILKKNFELLHSWPLAVTAYNYGLNGMLRARKQHGSDLRSILQKHRTGSFGFASKNFYAEFLAAVEIHRNHEKYFDGIQPVERFAFETIDLDHAMRIQDLVKAEALDENLLREYNPALTRFTWQQGVIPKGFQLRLPPGSSGQVADALETAAPASSAVSVEDESFHYRVQRGDSLSSIAELFGSSVAAIQSANGIRNRHKIRTGQRLIIPVSSKGRRTYRVRRGDTLDSIAQQFGTSTASIQRFNAIRDPDRIVSGQVLVIP